MLRYRISQRRAGVLLHPTSLPTGNLDYVFRWLDFMAESGLSVWQMLPLGIPQNGLSPYQCLSAFAVNPALLEQIRPASDRELKSDAFLQFCQREAHWLEDYGLFSLLKSEFAGTPWYHWPRRYRFHDQLQMKRLQRAHSKRLQGYYWEQYVLDRHWRSIREYALQREIRLFGDVPIFIGHDSADVWAHRERFLLDDQGIPTQVTGVPPDYFSETGQRWGNPHYDWERMEAEGFSWWLDRLHHHFQWFDLLRIDHFRGLEAVWMIDAKSGTAVEGHWQKTPGDKLLATLQQEMGEIPLVAEDLGVITDEVRALKKRFDLPGMSVLQFGFDAFEDNPHKPQNIPERAVAFTGTHDNDTTLGWFRSLTEDMKAHVLRELSVEQEAQVVDAMVRRALFSRAALAVIPFQDLLGLGSEARMNIPGTVENNWVWRFDPGQITQPDLTARIREWVEASQRLVDAEAENPEPEPLRLISSGPENREK